MSKLSQLMTWSSDPLSPRGETMAQIEKRYGLAHLEMIYNSDHTQVLSRKNGQTLYMEPHPIRNGREIVGRGFTLGVDYLEQNIRPVMAVKYREVTKGRFAVENVSFCMNNDGIVTPDQSVPAHKAMAEVVHLHTERKLAANKSAAEAEQKARAKRHARKRKPA